MKLSPTWRTENVFTPLAPQEEVQQQKTVPAVPNSVRPQLSPRQSLEAQYLQHRLQVGPFPGTPAQYVHPESAFLHTETCFAW